MLKKKEKTGSQKSEGNRLCLKASANACGYDGIKCSAREIGCPDAEIKTEKFHSNVVVAESYSNYYLFIFNLFKV